MPLVVAGIAGILAGVFACADTALTSVSEARLGALATEAARFREALQRAVARRERLHARYVAGRALALSIAAGAFGMWLAHPAHDDQRVVLAAGALFVAALLIEAASAMGRRAHDTLLPLLVVLLRPVELLLAPLAYLTSGLTDLLKWREKANRKVEEREMELVVDEGERRGTLQQEPAELIRNVLEFSDLTARDAMIPRMHIEAIKLDTPLDEVLRIVTETGHSRYPVYRDDMDDIFGLLCAKDLFQVLSLRTSLSSAPPAVPNGDGSAPPSARAQKLLDIVREPVKFVAESQPLSGLLREMRQERQHLAVVVDEYGGTSGIVTLEDLLEEIVGDIQDEYDVDEAPIVDLGQGRLIADAAVLVSDLSEYLGSELDPEGQYDSLGGMLTDKVGRVPTVGTSIPAGELHFIVRESDEKHISKVEIVRPALVSDTTGSHHAL
jgi:putative hemolysin